MEKEEEDRRKQDQVEEAKRSEEAAKPAAENSVAPDSSTTEEKKPNEEEQQTETALTAVTTQDQTSTQQTGPDPMTMAVGMLANSFFGGVAKWPSAIGFGVSFEGESFDVRASTAVDRRRQGPPTTPARRHRRDHAHGSRLRSAAPVSDGPSARR